MKNRKSKQLLFMVSGLCFLVALIGLIATSFYGPQAVGIYRFPANFVTGDDSEWITAASQALAPYQVEVRYPEQSWQGETFLIQINFLYDESAVASASESSLALILNTALEMDPVTAKPAKRILLPMQLPHLGSIQWEVTPEDHSLLQGKIWISLMSAQDAETSIPVLVLPVEVEVRSILGLEIRVWRYSWTVLGIVGLFLFVKNWTRTFH